MTVSSLRCLTLLPQLTSCDLFLSLTVSVPSTAAPLDHHRQGEICPRTTFEEHVLSGALQNISCNYCNRSFYQHHQSNSCWKIWYLNLKDINHEQKHLLLLQLHVLLYYCITVLLTSITYIRYHVSVFMS